MSLKSRWPLSLLVVFDSNDQRQRTESTFVLFVRIPSSSSPRGKPTVHRVRQSCLFLFCIYFLCHSIKHFVTSLVNKSASFFKNKSDSLIEPGKIQLKKGEERRGRSRLSMNFVVECGFRVDCQAGCQEDTRGGL